MWEYRLAAPFEVKSAVPLLDGNVAVLNSHEQAILELEVGTNRLLHRIPVPAKGNDHTHYTMLRRTPEGNYLVALRAEKRLVEVDRTGKQLHVYQALQMPVMGVRLSDGSTLATGRFGIIRLDAQWKETWSYGAADAAASFPLLYAWGVTELKDGRWLVANSDWHERREGWNRVQFFAVDSGKKISWQLPAAAYRRWNGVEGENVQGIVEYHSVVMQPLPPSATRK